MERTEIQKIYEKLVNTNPKFKEYAERTDGLSFEEITKGLTMEELIAKFNGDFSCIERLFNS